MLNSKSFLAIDFGAGSLKLAEFEQNDAGGLRLKQYGVKSLGLEGSQEANREAAMLKALQELMAEKNFGSRQSNVCAPGFHVFSKFVKLPPVDTSKVTQIIRYEAQQNVPFPLDEVVWDYQILGTSASNELEVLLVAVKSEIIEGLFRVGESAGLRIKLVDVSSAALCNAFRYNYGDVEGCSMLLDIGAKTSNLLFFEKGKVYARSITIGANSITQDFSHEAKLRFPDAEATKLEKGSVSLGGAYEEPEDPQAAAIAKIARQVMTRLHIQVNQTIQFYRGQQGGSAPERLYLSGGASIMPYTAQFFAEKLNLPVDYFNPFRNIEIGPALDLEELSKYAHSFGEVVGLGLRDLAHCPVELNLMPKSSIQRQEFAQKKPYLIAAIFSMALSVFLLHQAEAGLSKAREDQVAKAKLDLAKLTKTARQLKEEMSQTEGAMAEAKGVNEIADSHFYWMKLLGELRAIMLKAEADSRAALKAKTGQDIDTGIWVEVFEPELPEHSPYSGGNAGMGTDMIQRVPRATLGTTSGPDRRRPTTGAAGTAAANDKRRTAVRTVNASTDTISNISMTCRLVDRNKLLVSANADMAFSIQELLNASPWFKDAKLWDQGVMPDSSDTNTMTFQIDVGLKHPFKL
jgi:type IV pilus assembly protein PilM